MEESLHCLFFSATIIGYRIEGTGKDRFVQFEIICTCQLTKESKFYTSGSPFEWRMWKRYREFYNLLQELKLLKDTDFYKAESSIADVDPKILMKRIRKAPFPPRHDITFQNRFGSKFLKQRLSDLIEWFHLIGKIDPLFDFNFQSGCCQPIRCFLDIDYTLYLRKNDQWYAKDRRSLINYDDRDTFEREQDKGNENNYDDDDSQGHQVYSLDGHTEDKEGDGCVIG